MDKIWWNMALHFQNDSYQHDSTLSDGILKNIVICEYPTYTYCVSKAGLTSSGFLVDDVDEKAPETNYITIPNDCIQFCKLKDYDFSLIWKDTLGSIICFCKTTNPDVDLFILEQNNRLYY